MPSPGGCRSDEVTRHERRGRGWGASRCHPDHQEIPPHPLQMREVTADTGHAQIPVIVPIPHSLQAAKPDERESSSVAPCPFQFQRKATTSCWGRAKLPTHRPGCCRTAHATPDCWRFFRSVLMESYRCFFTAPEPGWTAARYAAESEQRLLGAAPQAVAVES